MLRSMRFAEELPSADVSNVEVLLEAGEQLLAFETLCTQIYEWEISLSADLIRELEEVGKALGARSLFTDSLWNDVAQ